MCIWKKKYLYCNTNTLNKIIVKHKPDLICKVKLETTCLKMGKGFNVIPSAGCSYDYEQR